MHNIIVSLNICQKKNNQNNIYHHIFRIMFLMLPLTNRTRKENFPLSCKQKSFFYDKIFRQAVAKKKKENQFWICLKQNTKYTRKYSKVLVLRNQHFIISKPLTTILMTNAKISNHHHIDILQGLFLNLHFQCKFKQPTISLGHTFYVTLFLLLYE